MSLLFCFLLLVYKIKKHIKNIIYYCNHPLACMYVSECVCAYAHTYTCKYMLHRTYVEVRRQPVGVSCLVPPHGLWELNSHLQDYQQACTTESSCRPCHNLKCTPQKHVVYSFTVCVPGTSPSYKLRCLCPLSNTPSLSLLTIILFSISVNVAPLDKSAKHRLTNKQASKNN